MLRLAAIPLAAFVVVGLIALHVAHWGELRDAA